MSSLKALYYMHASFFFLAQGPIHSESLPEHRKSRIRMSVELNDVFRVYLIAVENHKYLWVGQVVHTAVIEVDEAGILGGRSAVQRVSNSELSHQHSGQEHCLVGRLAGKYWRSESVSL